MFYRCPAIEGVPLIGNVMCFEGNSVSDTECVVWVSERIEGEGFVEITDIEYLSFFKAGRVTSDKTLISSDGTDAATVTITVHESIGEVTLYDADGNIIATLPVGPDHTATLSITATTPGSIFIRAGASTRTKLNEVVITAQ